VTRRHGDAEDPGSRGAEEQRSRGAEGLGSRGAGEQRRLCLDACSYCSILIMNKDDALRSSKQLLPR